MIVTTTLGELDRAAQAVDDPTMAMPAPARTGGGSALPMRDLIRMAAKAIHYLAVFDDHTELPIYLGRQKCIATADQRIICYARDGGCTRPGCIAPMPSTAMSTSTLPAFAKVSVVVKWLPSFSGAFSFSNIT